MVFLFYSICLFIFGNNKKREVEERREAPLSLSCLFFSSLFHIVILGSDFCPHTGRERGEERRD